MTKADEMNIENLMGNLRKMEAATAQDKNKAEIAAIRKFCIAAVTDYWDTNKRICAMINANRDLWPNPYIKGAYTGLVNGRPYRICGQFDRPDGVFVFETGAFAIYGTKEGYGEELMISVSGIHGCKRRTGYCGAWEDHDLVKTDWKADKISVADSESHNDCRPWANDLINGDFGARGVCDKLPYSVENLKKYNWSIEGWVGMKKMAERTRLRTEEIVRRFKHALEVRISIATDKVNAVTRESGAVYQKVEMGMNAA